MKKFTHITLIALITLCTTALVAFKKQPATHSTPVTQASNPAWFETIEIAEGVIVEFEYGQQLQVKVEGGSEQLALVLENKVLKAIGKSNGSTMEGVRIKVITPVLISLAMQAKPTHTNTNG